MMTQLLLLDGNEMSAFEFYQRYDKFVGMPHNEWEKLPTTRFEGDTEIYRYADDQFTLIGNSYSQPKLYLNIHKPIDNIESIGDLILKRENLDYEIKWWVVPPSENISDLKIIRISETFKDYAICYQFEILIHEITHCYVAEHDSFFYRKMGKLFTEYAFLMDNIKTNVK